ncbi:hypothetical protein IWQ62_004528, partial [Dispira parvispora]
MVSFWDQMAKDHPELLPYKECQQESRRTGLIAGATSGFLGYYLSSKVVKLTPKQSVVAGVLTGAITGFMFARNTMRSCAQRKNLKFPPPCPITSKEHPPRASLPTDPAGPGGNG